MLMLIRAVIRVLHDLSVLHVVVILFTLYQLSANKHAMDGWTLLSRKGPVIFLAFK